MICKSCGPLIDCLCSNGEVTSQSPKPSGPNPRPTGPGASVTYTKYPTDAPLSQGTPKTLDQAIRNGLNEFQPGMDAAHVVETHVRDFLAQKFGVAFYTVQDEAGLRDLWYRITGKEMKS